MGKSSKDKRDIYYRLAKEQGYRARSAFKLLQIQEEYDIFNNAKHIVDLCAAPGSWSQVLTRNLPDSKIVAVDLQQMSAITGVIPLKADITKEETVSEIIGLLGSKAELVVCDGAPDVTGLHDLDEYIQAQLLLAALNIGLHVLEDNGTFVAKIFRARDTMLLVSQMKLFFRKVEICKPAASRDSSIESFIVCREHFKPEGYQLSMMPMFMDDKQENLLGINRYICPFVACGSLEGYDSDMTYPLTGEYIEPVQKPIDPPYQAYLNAKRGN